MSIIMPHMNFLPSMRAATNVVDDGDDHDDYHRENMMILQPNCISYNLPYV